MSYTPMRGLDFKRSNNYRRLSLSATSNALPAIAHLVRGQIYLSGSSRYSLPEINLSPLPFLTSLTCNCHLQAGRV